nr:C25 family cysteine peptidase [Candidatus Krumholzibacteria bacterium]
MFNRIVTVLVLTFVMVFGTVAHAEWVSLDGKAAAQPQVDVMQADPGRTILNIDLPGFDSETVDVDGQPFARLRLPGHWFMLKEGQPELPFLTSSLIIPDEGTPAVRILDSTWREVESHPVLPSKGNLLRTEDPTQIPYTFGPAYLGGVYPAQEIELGEPYIMRDYRGVNLRLNPLRWDADRQVLMALESIRLEVVTEGTGGVNVKQARIQSTVDSQFQAMYSQRFDNFDAAAKYTMVPEEGNLLIVSHDSFMGIIGDFVDWKRQRGMNVEVISTGSVGGSTTGIKNAIQTRYDSPEGLTYVILVGDQAQVPTFSGTYESADDDTRYANCEGSDLYPDLFVSRISAQTPDDVLIQTQKFVTYERDPMAGGTWYAQASALASSEGSPADHERANWLRDDLLEYGFTNVDQIFQLYGDGASDIAAAVNEGRSLVYYIGHGSGSSWSNPYFTTADANNLSNGYKMPWVIDVSCSNGDFSQTECFAEGWLRSGTTAQPNGAVAMYSASTSTPWVPPCVMQAEAVNLLVTEQTHVIGSLYYHGMMQTLDEYPGSTGTQLVEQYNIFGDCTLQVRTKEPIQPVVAHGGVVVIGSTVFPIDTGVAGAQVSLYSNGVLHGTGVTDESGHCDVALSNPVVQGGEVTLTITGYNLLTHVEELNAIVPVVVDIQPASIPVGVTTEVTVTLTDPPAKGTTNVDVFIEGYGVEGLEGVTDQYGVVTFMVNPQFGETLNVRGREAGASYDMFNVELPVTGAAELTNPSLSAGVPGIGLVGSLTPFLEGELAGSAYESDLMLSFIGGGVSVSMSDAGNSLTLPVTPTMTGVGEAALMKTGYNVFAMPIDIVTAYGTVAGHVNDADNGGANVANAMVACYVAPYTPGDAAVFEYSTAFDGSWSHDEELAVGDYVLMVSKFGYLQSTESFFLMYGTNDLETGLGLAPFGDLSGTLTSSDDGSPIFGQVRVKRSDSGEQVAQIYSDETTGAYTITGLTYFDYEVLVTANQFVPQTVPVTIDAVSVVKDFILEPTVGNILVLDDNSGRDEMVSHEVKLDKIGQPLAAPYQAPAARSATDITAALTTMGYSVTYLPADSYDFSDWQNYNLVVMSSGDNTGTLNSTLKQHLRDLVNAGGHLLLEGGEVAYNHRADVDFAAEVMHITGWGSDNVGDLTVADPGHNVMSVPHSVDGPVTLTYSGYGDSDSVTPASDAQDPGAWSSGSGASVVCYDPNPAPQGGQIVFFTFNYSALAAGEREALLNNAVHYLITEEMGNSSVAGAVHVAGAPDDSGVTLSLNPGEHTLVTGADGNFVFDGLFAGNYSLMVTKDGWSSAAQNIVLGDNEQMVGLDFQLNAIMTTEFCDNPAMAIPDNDPTGGAYCSVNLPMHGPVSAVEVFVDITHTYQSDLVLELISPLGTVVRLHNNSGGSTDDIYTWYPAETTPFESLTAFIGEEMFGEWTLRVMDFGPQDYGTVNNWCLRLTYEAVATAAGDEDLPRTLVAEGNHPNPFNPMTTIKFAVPRDGKVDVSVYDVAGRRVAQVLSEVMTAGRQSVTWTGRDDQGQAVASGTYFYRVNAGGETVVGKMLLMK